MKSIEKTLKLTSLIEREKGARVVVDHIDSGIDLKGRLAELGIYPGEPIRIVHNSRKGPVLVSAKGATFMLGRGMAQKIYVR